jgi:hypothetical protein
MLLFWSFFFLQVVVLADSGLSPASLVDQRRVFHAQEDAPSGLNATFTSGLGRVAADSLKALGITMAFVIVIFLEACCIYPTKGNASAGSTSSLAAMRQPLLNDSELIELCVVPAQQQLLASPHASQVESAEHKPKTVDPLDDL